MYPMISLFREGIVGIVAIRNDKVWMAILIHVCDFHVATAKYRIEL